MPEDLSREKVDPVSTNALDNEDDLENNTASRQYTSALEFHFEW